MASGDSANAVDFRTILLTAVECGDFSLQCVKETKDSPFSVKGNESVIAYSLTELSADGPKRIQKLEVKILTPGLCNALLSVAPSFHVVELHLASVDLREIDAKLFHSTVLAFASVEKLVVDSWIARHDHLSGDFIRECAAKDIMHLEFPRSRPSDEDVYSVSDDAVVDFALSAKYKGKYRHLKLYYGNLSANFFHLLVERSQQSSLDSDVFLTLYPVQTTSQEGLDAYEDCKEEWANATVFKFRPRPPFSRMYLKVYFNYYDDSLHVYRVKDERFQPADE